MKIIFFLGCLSSFSAHHELYEFLQLSWLQRIVVPSLAAHGGSFFLSVIVSGIDYYGIIKGQYLFKERTMKRFRVPTGEIHSAAITHEQGIAGEEAVIHKHTHAVRRMPGSVNESHLQIAHLEDVAVLDGNLPERGRDGMRHDTRTRPGPERLVTADMVEMGMGVYDVAKGQTTIIYLTKYP